MDWKEKSNAFDIEQQYLSPGTAFGYGTLNATKQKPLGREINGDFGSFTLLDAHNDYAQWRASQGIGSNIPFSGTEQQGPHGTLAYEYFPFLESRYNTLYHSSLYSELIMHNLAVLGNNPLPSTNYGDTMDNLSLIHI